MSGGAGLGLVEQARDAAAGRDWQRAFELLMEADGDGLLGATDLPVLGEVAYAAGHLDVTIEAWERAHAACVQAGDEVAAAGAAVRVAMHLLFDTALMAPVRGWTARAERLLEGRGETPAHAWFAVVRTFERMLTGDLPSARRSARRAIEVGSMWDPAACALGRVAEARLLILDGDVQQGLALLDEAGVAAVSGDLDPLSTGVVYCELVCALQGLAQYDVAEEWTEAMERWCETNAIGSLHGRCRVHRAEILRLRGSCNDAESQALVACEELRPYLRRELGWPLNELGRIRLHKGDIAGAEEALLAAHRAGWDPQPGLALVRLAQGDAATAAASIRDALERPLRVPSKERPPNTDLQRAPLLEAQVEIEIAVGDIGRARSAADELELVAARFASKALVASATVARGRGVARRRRRRERRAVVVRSGAALERSRRPLRGGARTSGPRRCPCRQRQRAPRRLGTPSGPVDPRRDPSRAVGAPGSERRTPDAPDAQPAASLNIFRREGDYWTLIFEAQTVRVRDLKGMRYLARLLADPGREFHVLDLVAAETGSGAPVDRSPVGPACRARHSAMRARCSTSEPRMRTADASPRSRTTARKRSPSETTNGPRKRTRNETSSFKSSRAQLAWVVVIDEPRQRPSVLEWR